MALVSQCVLNNSEPSTQRYNGNASEFFWPGSRPCGLHLLGQTGMTLGEFDGSFCETDNDAIDGAGKEAHHNAAEDETDDESGTERDKRIVEVCDWCEKFGSECERRKAPCVTVVVQMPQHRMQVPIDL